MRCARARFRSCPTAEHTAFDVIARLQPGVSLEQAAARVEEVVGPAWGTPTAAVLHPRQDRSRTDQRRGAAGSRGGVERAERAHGDGGHHAARGMRKCDEPAAVAHGTAPHRVWRTPRTRQLEIRLARQLAAETFILAAIRRCPRDGCSPCGRSRAQRAEADDVSPGGRHRARSNGAFIACAALSLVTAALCVAMPWMHALRSRSADVAEGESRRHDQPRSRGSRAGARRRADRGRALVLIGGAVCSREASAISWRSISDSIRRHVLLVSPNLTSRTHDGRRDRAAAIHRSQSGCCLMSQSGQPRRIGSAFRDRLLRTRRTSGREACPHESELRRSRYFDTLGIALVRGRVVHGNVRARRNRRQRIARDSLSPARRTSRPPLHDEPGTAAHRRRRARHQGARFEDGSGVVSISPIRHSRRPVSRQPGRGFRRRNDSHSYSRGSVAGDSAIRRCCAISIRRRHSAKCGCFASTSIGWMAQSRSLVAVTGLFSVLTLLLSAVGLYGLISQMSPRR